MKIAGSMAAKDGVAKADPAILEPVMKVEVTTPEDFMGDVIGDLSSRRGKIGGMEQRGDAFELELVQDQLTVVQGPGAAVGRRARDRDGVIGR